MTLLLTAFTLPFAKTNIYRHFKEKNAEFQKDTLYSLLRSPSISWRRFLLNIALIALNFLRSLSEEHRDSVLIVDDSTLARPRAKKVELCSRVFDHTQSKLVKGFRFLCLGWSDGFSFLPLDFALLGSQKPHNIVHNSLEQRRADNEIYILELIDFKHLFFHKELAMNTNFHIQSRKSPTDLHVHLSGAFDATDAQRMHSHLVQEFAAQEISQGQRIFLDVRELKDLAQAERQLFWQCLEALPLRHESILFKGEQGFSLGRDGCKVLINKKKKCSCSSKCKVCACEQ